VSDLIICPTCEAQLCAFEARLRAQYNIASRQADKMGDEITISRQETTIATQAAQIKELKGKLKALKREVSLFARVYHGERGDNS